MGPRRPTSPDTNPPFAADECNFAQVYRGHQAFVWRTLHHLGLPKGTIDDALQDVFLVVHRRLPEYDAATSMRSWLYGIARRVASEYRRGTRRAIRPLQLVDDPDARMSKDRDAQRLEAAGMVASFLEVLDEDKRRAFLLAEVEGMTAPEIAEAEGANVNTVYARLRAARRRFSHAVKRYRRKATSEREGDDAAE